ncbi:hypothetical protein FACS189440_21010 [Bacteroidia bacterium]|nr:hypothetical protein FACS189440_21010 [Bacteroidia bacterium]
MRNKLKHFFCDRKGAERTETLEMLNRISEELNTINFSILWCAGSKASINQADKEALQYLFRFLEQVEKEYGKKTNLTIIFADTHAYLNGYSLDSMYAYFQEIQSISEKYNCNFTFSSALCKGEIIKKGFPDFTHYIDHIIKNPESLFKQIGLQITEVETFYQAAIKHCTRIGQHNSGISFKDEKEAVMAYFLFANFEKDIITENFSDTVFITYMTREEGGALPSLPIVRLYSIKSGLRTRPWFIN